ncbi:MAG: carboxypeptidase-like regulatory domain-containing protein, partial [Acidobacteria bacterium]|nr:carboxypeptidase-like regulatory domain-containing protein [Acidobacteriota bacterium]
MARPSVMKRAIVRILPGVVVLLIVGSLPTLAQRTTALLEGQVIDSAGAVIPGADITAVNIHTGFSRSTVSSDLGEYRISLLPVG